MGNGCIRCRCSSFPMQIKGNGWENGLPILIERRAPIAQYHTASSGTLSLQCSKLRESAPTGQLPPQRPAIARASTELGSLSAEINSAVSNFTVAPRVYVSNADSFRKSAYCNQAGKIFFLLAAQPACCLGSKFPCAGLCIKRRHASRIGLLHKKIAIRPFSPHCDSRVIIYTHFIML